jgi:hypothetical protein
MSAERIFLLLAGIAVFVLGAWLHRDRAALAGTLVVIGAVLVLVGVVLPFLQNVQGEVAGVAFQIELVRLPEPISAESLGELRGEVVPDSGADAFSRLLRTQRTTVYTVVGIGDGRRWLTSRLLVFAIVLRKLRGTRCLVITAAPSGDEIERFVGTVCPDDLRRSFSWEYPWLEEAVASAWKAIRETAPAPDLTPQLADRLLHDVTKKLVGQPVQQDGTEWAIVRGGTEHARWVDEGVLASVLGPGLDRRRITAASVAEVDAASILAAGGDLLAVVDHENRFLGLLDRRALVEARASGKTD